jgi:hypothetical protein
LSESSFDSTFTFELVHWHYIKELRERAHALGSVQVREMSWYNYNYTDDGEYDYYDSDNEGQYLNDDGYDYGHGDNVYDDGYDLGEDDSDDDEESIESDSSYQRRSIISGLHASCIQHLDLSDVVWESFVTMESFQPDMENIIVALQSNRSLETINISTEVLAAIGESE